MFENPGGYSKDYVPFCGLAVIEAMSKVSSSAKDPYLPEVKSWGYQECLPHQAAIIDVAAAINGLDGLDALSLKRKADETLALSRPEMGVYNSLKVLLSAIKDPERKKAILQVLTETE